MSTTTKPRRRIIGSTALAQARAASNSNSDSDTPQLSPMRHGSEGPSPRQLDEQPIGNSSRQPSPNDVSSPPAAGAPPSPSPPTPPKAKSDLVVRTVYSLLMAYTFLALVAAGCITMLPLILTVMGLMFSEILRINQRARKERLLPVFRRLPWYFLSVTLLMMLTANVKDQLTHLWPPSIVLYKSFGFIFFSLYVAGFVGFVLSLQPGYYRYQIRQFTWIAMTLIFIVGQGSLQLTNMMKGMIWFLLPVSCVVHNDIWAYAFGRSFGRTPLLLLSPKKTVEGFIGAFFSTVIWNFWFAGFLSKFPLLTCPQTAFTLPTECERSPLFEFYTVQVPQAVTLLTVGLVNEFEICNAQLHALVLATFASLIAPFGGFFASALKRAHKLKDFGDLIPGHGGMTDRMDCQIMMGAFTFVYLESFVFANNRTMAFRGCAATVSGLYQCALKLSAEDLNTLIERLGTLQAESNGQSLLTK